MSALLWLGTMLRLTAALAAPLPLAAAGVARWTRPEDGLAHRLLVGVLLALLVDAAVVVGLGMVGWLAPWPLTIALAATAACGLLACRGRGAALAALWCALRISLAPPPREAPWPTRWAWILGAAAVVGAIAGILTVPTRNYDSLMYQLPTLGEWWRTGSVWARQEQWQHARPFEQGILHYPCAWNAVLLIAAVVGPGTQAALLPNLGGWLLLGCAIHGLARLLGAERTPARAATALVLLTPLLADNLQAAHVDLALGTAVVTALALLARHALRGDRAAGWLGVAALGWAIGIKMSALPIAAVALGWWAWLRWRRPAPVAPLPARGAWLVAAIALPLLGASWYVHAWLVTGNPLGFVRVAVLGRTWFDGAIDAAYIARTSLLGTFAPTRPWHWALVGGALPVELGALAAALALSAPAMLRRLRGDPSARAATAVAAALAWLYVAGPWSGKHAHHADLGWWLAQQLRYTVALWSVLAALAAAATPGPRAARCWTFAAIAAAAAFPWWSDARWTAGPVAAVVAVALAIARSRRRWTVPWPARLAAGFALIGLLRVATLLHAARADADGFGVPGFLRDRLAPTQPIAAWATHQSWLLYGDDLRRPVRFLDLGNVPADGLDERIRATDADWLAIGPWVEDFPPERFRAVQASPALELAHGDPSRWGMLVYRIRRAPLRR